MRFLKKNICFLILLLAADFSVAQQNPKKVDPGFFPIGVWLQSTHNAQRYRDAGINLYVGLYRDLDAKQMKDLSDAEMKVMCDQGEFGLHNLNNPLIYGWTQNDEPDNAQWNPVTQQYDPCVDPKIIISTYQSIKKKDPGRPVYLNLGQGVSYVNWIGRGTCTGNTSLYSSENGYLKGCDIASFDIYPANSQDKEVHGKLWYVAKGVDSLKKWTGNAKPVWVWIETTKIDSTSIRKPKTVEVKAEVWMALIHGATGFGYFCHSWTPVFNESGLLHDTAMLKAVKEINTQVTSLAEVLNSPDTKDYATVKSASDTVPIDMMAKQNGKDRYIFAVAMRNGTTTATFTVRSGNTVEVLGENRKIAINSGEFKDRFNPFEVHLYKISAASL